MPLTITHAKSNTIGDFTGAVTVYNSAGATTTAQATDLVRPSDWNSAHQVSLTLTGSEIGSLFAAGSGLTLATNTSGVTYGIQQNNFYEPFPVENSNSVMDAPTMGTWYFAPFVAPYGIGSGRFQLPCQRDSSLFLNAVVAVSNSTGSYSATAGFRNCLAVYSLVTGSSNSLLSSVWTGEAGWSASVSRAWSGATNGMTVSNYLTIGFNSQFDSTGGVTTTTQTTSGTFSTATTSMASTAPNSLITGAQNWFTGSVMDVVPLSSAIKAGAYWMANMFTTASGAAGTTGANFTSVGQTYFNGSNSRLGFMNVQLSAFRRAGAATSANATTCGVPFCGSLLTGSSNATSALGTVNIQNFTRRHYWNYVQDTL